MVNRKTFPNPSQPNRSAPASEMAKRLWDALPAVARRLDEPTPEDQGQGALRRLIGVLGAGLDRAKDGADAHCDRHDLDRAPTARLPDLASWIGWPLDLRDEVAARRDIRFAPEVYRTLGTEAGIAALVRQNTGWDVAFRRLADRVLFTATAERARGWDLMTCVGAGTAWGSHTVDPALSSLGGLGIRDVSGGGPNFSVLHCRVNGRWRIYMSIADGATEPLTSAEPESDRDDWSPAAALDEAGGLWCFFISNRGGRARLWCRDPSGALNLMGERDGEDSAPAALRLPDGRVLVVWRNTTINSSRILLNLRGARGWLQAPVPVGNDGGGGAPTACCDNAGKIWLAWSAPGPEGTRPVVWMQRGGDWAPTLGPSAPGAVWQEELSLAPHGGSIALAWSAEIAGRWRVCTAQRETTGWTTPKLHGEGRADAREPQLTPTANGALRLRWRDQHLRRWMDCRTLDTGDAAGLAAMDTPTDSVRYTYQKGNFDAATIEARLSVGDTDPALVAQRIAWLQQFLAPFLPIHLTIRWVPVFEPAPFEEPIALSLALTVSDPSFPESTP